MRHPRSHCPRRRNRAVRTGYAVCRSSARRDNAPLTAQSRRVGTPRALRPRITQNDPLPANHCPLTTVHCLFTVAAFGANERRTELGEKCVKTTHRAFSTYPPKPPILGRNEPQNESEAGGCLKISALAAVASLSPPGFRRSRRWGQYVHTGRHRCQNHWPWSLCDNLGIRPVAPLCERRTY
jgi:hypothetical protein